MNLRWISLFATVAEEGSFTRAATKLHIAQPWLSAQIRKLEYELGIELLIRDNVGVRVSEAGAQLLPHASQLAQSAQLFRETARSLGEDRMRALKLGCHIPLIDIPRFKTVALQFAQKFGNFELTTMADTPAALLKALDERRIDLALLPAEAGLVDGGPDLETLSVGETSVYLLAPKQKKFSKLEDLAGVAVGIPPEERGRALHKRLKVRFEELEIIPSPIPEFDRRAIEHAVLTRGDIVAVSIEDEILKTLDPGVRSFKVDGITVDQRFCRIGGRDLGRAAERFWNLCISEFEQAVV
ncbi:LysR family transcriptional regulator [Hyphomonas johnsonii]|uniref:LysR family transcriptional regulator n=1 Tax=Hyphomonas johnsonii MHS-2 TaxID=1280950 RepID=A0A059FU83_9PROT|nr:LysR family transcriptional regulator [Hyphomonas johnsonii]KCZ94239.1 LysR family transcriptional regulator [Hyphomonas johnsonii MHS-2]